MKMRKTIEKVNFFTQFLKDRQVASITPTSILTVKRVCDRYIPSDRPLTLLEYGPGVGVFTRYLREYLHPDSKIIAIEYNPAFHKHLTSLSESEAGCVMIPIKNDVRNVLEIAAAMGLEQVDFVLSGVPLSLFGEKERIELVEATRSLLKDDGAFLIYQVSLKMLPYLKEAFPYVEHRTQWLNIPPLDIMCARMRR